MRDYESYSEIYESTPTRKRRRRFDDEAPARSRRPAPDLSALDERLGADPDGPPEGDRWSTWDGAEHRPQPRPAWVVTEHAAVDTEQMVTHTLPLDQFAEAVELVRRGEGLKVQIAPSA